jgi:hypothetical protein
LCGSAPRGARRLVEKIEQDFAACVYVRGEDKQVSKQRLRKWVPFLKSGGQQHRPTAYQVEWVSKGG